MLLKNGLDFFNLIKEIFGCERTKDCLELFPHLIPLDQEDIFSFSKDEKEEFFHSLNILVMVLKYSLIGLRIIILGGEIKVDGIGISVNRCKESAVEIFPFSTENSLDPEFFKACATIISIVNNKLHANRIRIYRLIFVINSSINLRECWQPSQNLFACVKYWNSKTRKWSRLPEGRVTRMSIKEAGDIFQGLSYKILGFDNNIVNIRLMYKEVIVTFKTEQNELKVKKLFCETKKKETKKDIKVIKEIVNSVFFLLMEEAKFSELLNSNFPKIFLLKWLVKIRNFCLGRYSLKRNFQIIFSQEDR